MEEEKNEEEGGSSFGSRSVDEAIVCLWGNGGV